MCPGSITVAGYGPISMVNAKTNKPGHKTGTVEVDAGAGIVPHMKGRSYFADACKEGHYDSRQYSALQLLGKTMSYSVDLSAASCGCNAALYLTSLHQNADTSTCDDYYCDANKVCGVNCAEIDLMEANNRAFYSTFHVQDDGGGMGGGYGSARRDWNSTVYGPGARCIDTRYAFKVAVSFPVNAKGKLRAMEVTLSQQGKPCHLPVRVANYNPFGRDGMQELSDALVAGMTPIVSYWGAGETMMWLDGPGGDGQGPCNKDTPQRCGDSVRFFDFAIEDSESIVHVLQ